MRRRGPRRAEDRAGTTRSSTWRSWPRSAPSTRTTCRSSAPTARWTSTTAACGPSTPRARRSSTRSTTRTTSTYIAEEVRPWSYMKFPFIKSLGPENGWYRVGPLARVNTCDFIDTPEAEAARKEFKALTGGKPEQHHHGLPLGADDRAAALGREDRRAAARPGPAGHRPGGRRASAASEGVGAHRGAARHAVPPLPGRRERPGDDGQPDRLDDQQQRADEPGRPEGRPTDHLSGRPEITEGLLNHIEVAIRAYDPCLSCATHALGQMPLEVTLVGADGAVLDRRARPRVTRAGDHSSSATATPAAGTTASGRRFAAAGRRAGPAGGCTVETDYQLQVEDAAQLAARGRVVFVDADRRGPAPFGFGGSSPRPAGSASPATASRPGACWRWPGALRRPCRRPGCSASAATTSTASARGCRPAARANLGRHRRALETLAAGGGAGWSVAVRPPCRRWKDEADHARRNTVILCVDDDQDILASLRTVLEATGYAIVGAASAEDGLRAYRENGRTSSSST